jgi:hypothetical protein
MRITLCVLLLVVKLVSHTLMANYRWKKATDPGDVANLSGRHPYMPIRNAMVSSVLRNDNLEFYLFPESE